MVNFAFDVNDLIKVNRVFQNDINILKEWSSNNNKIPNLNSQQVCIFLIACDNNLENSKKCIEGFYKIRMNTPEVFDNRNTFNQDIIELFNTQSICLFPKRTKENYAIVLERLKDPDPSKYHMDHSMKVFFMLYDAIVYQSPPDGVILLFDMDKSSFRHITRMQIRLLKVLTQYIQDFVPLKIKSIHILNSLWFLPHFLNLLKPFMNKELMNKVHSHLPNNLEEIYENYVPKSHLPLEYGGDLPPLDKIHAYTYKKLTLLNDYFAEDEMERKELLNQLNENA